MLRLKGFAERIWGEARKDLIVQIMLFHSDHRLLPPQPPNRTTIIGRLTNMCFRYVRWLSDGNPNPILCLTRECSFQGIITLLITDMCGTAVRLLQIADRNNRFHI